MKTIQQALYEVADRVSFCSEFCAVRSRPIKVLVTVVCEDGLNHEYEEGLDEEPGAIAPTL